MSEKELLNVLYERVANLEQLHALDQELRAIVQEKLASLKNENLALSKENSDWLDIWQKLLSRIDVLEAETLRLQSRIGELESQIRTQ